MGVPGTAFKCKDVNSKLIKILINDIFGAGVDPRRRYYGLVADGGGFMRGCADDILSNVASGPAGSGTFGWDFDGSYADWYGGHELGHAYGRKHVGGSDSCGSIQSNDPFFDTSYPFPMGFIGDPTFMDPFADFFGFDLG